MNRHPNGFTMIELIMVIVLVGILAVVAAPKLGSLEAYNVHRASYDLLEAIRYAQEQSMINSGANDFQIAISGTGYTVTQSGTSISNPLTGASGYTQDASEWSGISLSGGQTISFDHRGIPSCSATACSDPGDTSATITLSKSGETASITIEKFTGYAHLN